MKKSYAKEFKKGPVFNLSQLEEFGGSWELEGRGAGIGDEWVAIGLFMERKYATMLMKAITLKAREKKKK